MSVGSSTDTFTTGPEFFDDAKYESTVSTSIDPDPAQIEEQFNKPLSERVAHVRPYNDGVRGTCPLDDVIVDCVTPAYRQHQMNEWNAVKVEAEDRYGTSKFVAIGSGIAAAIGAVILAARKEAAGVIGTTIADSAFAPVLLIAGCVVAVASLFFIARENDSINQATDQINGWNIDPVLKKGTERNQAHAQGFPFIFDQKLKLGDKPSRKALFHPTQVRYEYEKYFTAFCKKLLSATNPCPTAWINQFRSSNPISTAMMTYALGHVPEHMKPVIEDCGRFESFLGDIANSYDTLKTDARAAAKDRIDGYEKTKNEQLKPLIDARNTGIATAQTDRDRVLRDLGASDLSRKQAKDTFKAIKEALDANYALSASPIVKKYDAKIKEAETERDDRLRKLDAQKSKQLGNNYNAAHELLVRAKQAWDNKGYQQVNFQQYFPYQNVQPVYYQAAQPVGPVYYQQQQPAPVYTQQPPVYTQQPAPVYQQQQQPAFVPPPQTPNIYPQVPQTGNQGYGQFSYGYPVQQQIPAQQHYVYVPTAPPQ